MKKKLFMAKIEKWGYVDSRYSLEYQVIDTITQPVYATDYQQAEKLVKEEYAGEHGYQLSCLYEALGTPEE